MQLKWKWIRRSWKIEKSITYELFFLHIYSFVSFKFSSKRAYVHYILFYYYFFMNFIKSRLNTTYVSADRDVAVFKVFLFYFPLTISIWTYLGTIQFMYYVVYWIESVFGSDVNGTLVGSIVGLKAWLNSWIDDNVVLLICYFFFCFSLHCNWLKNGTEWALMSMLLMMMLLLSATKPILFLCQSVSYVIGSVQLRERFVLCSRFSCVQNTK